MSVLSPKPRAVAGEPPSKVWRSVRLGDIAKTASGGTPKRTVPSFYGGNIPWVKSGELGDSTVYETEESITEAGLKGSSAKIFPKGTLCVALYGATVGKLGILGMDAATNQAVCGIFLPSEMDTKFAYRFLESKRRELVEMGKGGAQPNISQEIIRDLQFPLPSLDQQLEIVAEIEKQFTRLEAGVGALKRVQANLKRYRAAVLKAACEGKLVSTEAELAKADGRSYETGEQLLQRILTERRANWSGRGKYKEPSAPDTTDLPKLPEGWVWATVEQLGQIETGNTPPKAVSANYGNDIPFVKPPELLDRPVFSAADNLSKLGASIGTVAQIGGVLVSCIGNLGKTAIAAREVAFNQQINAIIPPLLESARWIFYAVQQGNFRRQLESVASATTIAIVNKGKFSTLSIPLPPLAEQKRIVEEVERRLSVIDGMEANVSTNLQRSTRLRQSILQKAFSP